MIHAREDDNRIQDPEGLIPDDEPVFLLRAQDQAAESTLRHYANIVENMGADQELVTSVRDHIQTVKSWQEQNKDKVKVPDL